MVIQVLQALDSDWFLLVGRLKRFRTTTCETSVTRASGDFCARESKFHTCE
jgi:hypothetical protein